MKNSEQVSDFFGDKKSRAARITDNRWEMMVESMREGAIASVLKNMTLEELELTVYGVIRLNSERLLGWENFQGRA